MHHGEIWMRRIKFLENEIALTRILTSGNPFILIRPAACAGAH